MTPAPARPPSREPRQIAGMFDAIAGRYDLLNRTLSAGLDQRWRRRAIRSLRLSNDDVLLDLCAGTADLAIQAVRAPSPPARTLGIDFAGRMLGIGRDKIGRAGLKIPLVQADASALPLAADSVDAVAIAFGIRNVAHQRQALAEIFRVLRRNGRLAILEFGFPAWGPWRALYRWYFERLLPRIGRLVSRHRQAYSYLPASVGGFPEPGEFRRWLQDAGFARVEVEPLTGGVVYLYTARRNPEAESGERVIIV